MIEIRVGLDGRVLGTSLSAAPELESCVTAAVAEWPLEPAKTCLGEPVIGIFALPYREVFPHRPHTHPSGPLPPEITGQ